MSKNASLNVEQFQIFSAGVFAVAIPLFVVEVIVLPKPLSTGVDDD
jgi:hypothetical protein